MLCITLDELVLKVPSGLQHHEDTQIAKGGKPLCDWDQAALEGRGQYNS